MFIVIDGIDGAGKSTQINLLHDFLQERSKKKIIRTREPGGTAVAESIRKTLFLPNTHDKFTELFLYLAARRDHFLNCIQPEIDSGSIVLCDRFIYSTIAYQGYGFGIDINLLKELNTLIIPKQYLADATIILDLTVASSISRAKQAGNTKYEKILNQEFFTRVRNGFISLSKEENTHLIEGDQDINAVHSDIVKAVSTNLSIE